MNKIGIVIKETYRKNVKSASFWVMLLSPILMMAVIFGFTYFINQAEQGADDASIAVVGADPELTQVIQAANSNLDLHFDLDEDQARQALGAKEIEGYLKVDQAGGQTTAAYYKIPATDSVNLTEIQAGLQQYLLTKVGAQMGITPEQYQQLASVNGAIETVVLETNDAGEVTEGAADGMQTAINTIIATAVAFMIYLFVIIYSSMIAQEIASEKGSRVMEIILSSITAKTHFFGKMIGISLVLLTQFAVYAVMLAGAYFLSPAQDFLRQLEIDLGQVIRDSSQIILYGLLFAFVGIMIYAALAGFLGSLVSKVEDVNKVITPLMLLIIIGFYLASYGMNDPNNTIVRVASYIPFFSPLIVLFRIATQTIHSTEILVILAICAVFMVICLFLASMLYKSNALVVSDKGPLQTFRRSISLWRSEKHS